MNKIESFNNTMDFLHTLSFSREKREFFIALHKFIHELNAYLTKNYFCFFHQMNHVCFAGGAIRDALLLDISDIKDLDIICIIDKSTLTNPERSDIINNIRLQQELLKLDDINHAINNGEDFSTISENVILESINKKFNYKHNSLSIALRKFILTMYLEEKFVCNSQYNIRKEGISTEIIPDNYGLGNINNLIGLIKTNVEFPLINKKFDIDFLITKTSTYMEHNFDLHICQAQFPHSKIELYPNISDQDEFIGFYKSNKFKEELDYIIQQENDYIDFIYENIDDDLVFFQYLNNYICLTEGFIFNATNKVITFNSSNRYEIENSLEKHYQRVFKKYPYPLMFINEQDKSTSVYNILKEKNLDISLW